MQSRVRPRQSAVRSSALMPGPNKRSIALVAKHERTEAPNRADDD
jgi:hypothetical protein